MKTGLLLVIGVFICWRSFGQEVNEVAKGLSINAKYNHNFLSGGFVRVREWEFIGDKMKLQDLGINDFPSFELELERTWSAGNKFALAAEFLFIHGRSTHDR